MTANDRTAGALEIRSVMILFIALAVSGCSSECGGDIYPDLEDLSASSAIMHASVEDGGPPGPVTDIRRGDGAIAQPGRQLRVRVQAFDDDGQRLGDADITFLFPAFERERYGSAAWGIDSGEVPDYFSVHLAGMQVGGKREFVLPGIGNGPGDEQRHFRTRGNSEPGLEIPRDNTRLVVEVTAICKPRFCLKTRYSVPSAKTSRVTESGCR